MKGKGASILLGVIFVGVGIGLSIWGVKTLQKARASTAWPSVSGRVVSSDVERQTRTHRSGGRRRSSVTYHAGVVTAYEVHGTRYTTDKVSFGATDSSSRRRADEVVRRYPKGEEVKVFYHPARPGVAVLEPGVSAGVYIPLVIGVVFGGLGVLISVAVLVRRR